VCSERGTSLCPKIGLDATELLRCHGCARSNSDDVSAEHVAVLKMRHFVVPEIRTGATEPLRCRDYVRSYDEDGI